MNSNAYSTPKYQHGVALITALIFLSVISVLSLTSMRASTTGISLAHNEEARFAAIEVAQGMTELIAATPASTPVIGGAGFAICTVGELGCDITNIIVPDVFLAAEVAGGHLTARIQRMTPPDKPPPRVVESSIDKFSAASFQITATFDRSQEGLGRVRLVEGLLVLVPKT